MTSYLAPVKPEKLRQYLVKHGWEGPCRIGKHSFMVKNDLRLRLPDTAEDELISVDLLKRILLMAGVELN
jgi:predicted RNA binding protein YcfA (HicA-like mRNA interferase family)